MCWLLYMNLDFTKHTTDGLFLLRDRKVSICMLFQKFCLGWKLSPIINRWGVGIRMSWWKKRSLKRSRFDIYQLGFSVSPSNRLLDQQNLGSDSCNVLKEKNLKKNSNRHAAFHYTQSSLWVILIYTYDIKL